MKRYFDPKAMGYVQDILERIARTRDNDMMLYKEYLYWYTKFSPYASVVGLVAAITDDRIPSPEHISRLARKIKVKYPGLRGKNRLAREAKTRQIKAELKGTKDATIPMTYDTGVIH